MEEGPYLGEQDSVPYARLIQTPPTHTTDSSARLVITSFLAACIILLPFWIVIQFNSTCVRSDKETPQVDASCLRIGGRYYVHITKTERGMASVISVRFLLLNATGFAIPEQQGSVKEIYGLNANDATTNITFMDRDLNGRVSKGDFFIVKHEIIGGPGRDGHFFLLKFDTTGDKMNGGGTKLQ